MASAGRLLRRRRLLLMRIERATPADIPAVEALLSAAGLPLEGAAAALSSRRRRARR